MRSPQLVNIYQTCLGAEVGVAAGAIPIARDGLGVNRADDTEVLAHAVHNEAGHPQVVAHLNADTRPYLVLPLRRKCVA